MPKQVAFKFAVEADGVYNTSDQQDVGYGASSCIAESLRQLIQMIEDHGDKPGLSKGNLIDVKGTKFGEWAFGVRHGDTED